MSWISLGTLTPENLGEWLSFSGTVFDNVATQPTYKITCTNVNPGDKFKSFCWFRFQFFDPTDEVLLPLPAIKIYPVDEPLVREIQLPQVLLDIGVVVWIPEIQKRVRPNFLGSTTEPSWGVKLEEWRSDASLPVYPDISFNY